MKKLIGVIAFFFITSHAFAADEIISQRTYNQKVYDLGNGQKNYKIHVAQIHYKDGQGNFQQIDTKLAFDDKSKTWKHSKASYRPTIPEYANGWFEFYNNYEGANHTIKARPICDHVKGVYTESAEDGNYVLYKDAFGKGIDLKVYSYWAGLKKVICINEKPIDTSKDITFDFELELPLTKSSEISTASIKVTSPTGIWDKTSQLDFTDKTIKIGEQGKESYFRNAWLWDSGELRQPVDIELYVQGNKTYLRKTIKADVLEKAVYPLYTDHPTSYYAGVGDGHVTNGTVDWDTIHNATTGTSASSTFAWVEASNVITIRRTFFPIDTSGIADGDTITAAILYLYCNTKINSDNDGQDYINIVQTSQANPTVLAVADYDKCGSVHTPSTGATAIDIGDIATSSYNAFTLNETGRSWIDKVNANNTLLGAREGHDLEDAPAAAQNQVKFITSEDTSGTKDPYLDVTVSASTSAALSGTVTTATETDIVNGGKTVVLTLTGDTWVTTGATFDAQRQNIINGIDSAQSEATGWDAEVKAKIPVTDVVRTSDTVVTITLSAEAAYNITATETITATIPATALTGNAQIVASPTFQVTAVAASGQYMTTSKYW